MASGDIIVSRYITSDPNTNFIGQWSSTPNAGNNTSSVNIKIYATKQTGNPIVARDVTTSISATPTGYDSAITKSETVQLTLIPGSQQQQTIFDQTWTNISHDAEGNCSVTLSISVSGEVQGTGAQTITLDHIDRPTSVVATLTNKTETSATINWSTLAAIDYLWYSTNNGSTWIANGSISGTSGSITITGLSANTSYSLKVKVRKQSNQATSESETIAVTTYSYPYATSMPDFNIGSSLRVGLYNPLGRSVSVKLQDSSGNQMGSQSTSGTSVTGFSGATVSTALYGSIPNSKSGTYKIAITYGGHTETRTGGKYYTVEADCRPELNTPTYADTNSIVTAVTGDDQIIVQSKSTPKVTVTGLASKKSATIASVTAVVPGQTKTLTLSGTTAEGTLNATTSAVNMTCTVTITDSRGYTASKTVTMTVAAYYYPKVSAIVRRHNNFYTDTDITPSVDFSAIGTNAISIGYNATSAAGTVSGTLTNNTTSTIQLDNEYDWTVTIWAVDSFSSLSPIVAFVSKGTPIIFFDRDKYSVGINGFPKFDKTFEVDGAVMNRNVMTATATTSTTGTSSQKISVAAGTAVGDQLTIDSGSVKIGAKLSKVLVSASVSSTTGSVGVHTVSIKKGNTVMAYAYCNMTSVSSDTVSVMPVLISVAENDTLDLYVAGFASSELIDVKMTVEAMA